MDTALGAEPAVRPASLDRDGHALEPGLLPFLLVEDLGARTWPLGPAQVHAQEHLGPVGRLGAAGSGADHQQRVAVVVLAREQQGGPLAAEVGLEGGGVALELGLEVGVGRLGQELDGGEEVVRARLEIAPHGDLLAEAVGLAQDRLGGRLSSQKPGSWVSVSSSATRASLASRSKTPRGRPDPFGQVADGGGST